MWGYILPPKNKDKKNIEYEVEKINNEKLSVSVRNCVV